MSWRVIVGDCIEVMRGMAEASVDAIVTDPPYGLEFMGKEWDRLAGTPGYNEHGRITNRPDAQVPYGRGGGVNSYQAGAPMQEWHHAWAAEALRVLKPGGHLLAFGGTRTYHRLACAIEDAGFEIRDCVAWMYGSGFPKSLDVSKAIDKRGGNPHLAVEIGAAIKDSRLARGWTTGQADRHFCNGSTNWTWYEGRKGECRPPTPADFARIVAEWPELARLAEQVAEVDREVVGTKQAGIGTGKAYGKIVGEREPVVTTQVDITAPATPDAQRWQGWGTALKPAFEPIVVARKPLVGTVAANVLAHETGALNIDGTRIEGVPPSVPQPAFDSPTGAIYGFKAGEGRNGEMSHAAGRWPANVVLDEEAAAMLDEQSGERPSVGHYTKSLSRPKTINRGVVFTNPDMGSTREVLNKYAGQTGGASRFFYCAKADREERTSTNSHPTVKPVALMQWLVRLVTPPAGTVLDPFTGSGSTGIAALREGFDFIGIEREAEYVEIARDRIRGDAPLFNVASECADADDPPKAKARSRLKAKIAGESK